MFRTTKRSEMRSCGTSGLDLKSWALEEAIPHTCPKFAAGEQGWQPERRTFVR